MATCRNADAVRHLADLAVIGQARADRLATAVGSSKCSSTSRAEVDDATVVAALDEPDDLEDFVTQVARWVTSR